MSKRNIYELDKRMKNTDRRSRICQEDYFEYTESILKRISILFGQIVVANRTVDTSSNPEWGGIKLQFVIFSYLLILERCEVIWFLPSYD